MDALIKEKLKELTEQKQKIIDILDLNKNNSSSSNILKIPIPPVFQTLNDVDTWLGSLPTEGNLRKDASEAFHVGYQLAPKQATELASSRGNLGAIQRLLDNVNQNLPRIRQFLIDDSKNIYSYDKNNKLVVKNGAFLQQLGELAFFMYGLITLTSLKSEILTPQPGPPQPESEPVPKPTPASGKQDAIDYFNKRYREMELMGSTGISWIDQVIGDAKAGLARYSLIQPPTVDSMYFVEYFTTLYDLSMGKKPDIQEDQKQKELDEANALWRKQFWDKYKWWIIGGGVGVVTVFAVTQLM